MVPVVGSLSFAGLIAFLVLGFIFRKKDSRKAKRNFLISAGCFVLFIVMIAITPPKDSQADTPPDKAQAEGAKKSPAPEATKDTATPKPEEPKKEEPQLTVDQKVNNAIVDAVSAQTNMKKDRIAELQVVEHAGTKVEGDKLVTAKLNADENFTNNMTKDGMKLDSNKVFQPIFSIPEVEEVALEWQLPLTDAYGNVKDVSVLKITMKREAADKVNWKNFDKDNYKVIADMYWEHPALNK